MLAHHDDGSTDIKPEGYKEPDWSKTFNHKVSRFVKDIMDQREEILKAFIAKHGCEPDEIEQCVQYGPEQTIFFVRKRHSTWTANQ